MKTTEYIDQLRPLTKTGTDYAVAKLLAITSEAVHAYTREGRTMNNGTAAKVAQLLKMDPFAVIADMEAERAKDPEGMRYWKALGKRYGRRAAAVLLGITAATLVLGGETSNASTTNSERDSVSASVMQDASAITCDYVKSPLFLLGLFLLGLLGLFGTEQHPKRAYFRGRAA